MLIWTLLYSQYSVHWTLYIYIQWDPLKYRILRRHLCILWAYFLPLKTIKFYQWLESQILIQLIRVNCSVSWSMDHKIASRLPNPQFYDSHCIIHKLAVSVHTVRTDFCLFFLFSLSHSLPLSVCFKISFFTFLFNQSSSPSWFRSKQPRSKELTYRL